jgi:hypothetical protein
MCIPVDAGPVSSIFSEKKTCESTLLVLLLTSRCPNAKTKLPNALAFLKVAAEKENLPSGTV